ncbi:MAG TPA: polynucleotide adenylyltransferase PcnB, partial [Rubrivivax sp.]|nr:polynucleotide adenylyltransferase PcnB [Rubrivivax sp.]
SGRGKLAADMREIWLMQPRFERRTASSSASLIAQVRFRAGYDFLRLRADCGEVSVDLADWWEDFHLGDDDEREALLQDLRATTPPKVRRVPAAEGAPRAPAAPATKADPLPQEGDTAPRKRRRRRRKPAGEGGGGSGGGDSRPATAE